MYRFREGTCRTKSEEGRECELPCKIYLGKVTSCHHEREKAGKVPMDDVLEEQITPPNHLRMKSIKIRKVFTQMRISLFQRLC